MTKAEIDTIRARCDKATPGPWELDKNIMDTDWLICCEENEQNEELKADRWKIGADACERAITEAEPMKFTKGKIYNFRYSGGRKQRSPLGAPSRGGFSNIKYSFVQNVRGHGVEMFLFVSVLGKWRECFTTHQLSDYQIEKAA